MRDSSKGVVPGATVTATNRDGHDITTVTNEDGYFQAPYLIAGTYKLTVELQGFKNYVREASRSASPIASSSTSRSRSAAPSKKSP